MEYQKENTNKGVLVSSTALERSGLRPEGLELKALEGAAVFLNGRMTAPELIDAAQSLQTLSAALLVCLSNACGKCCGCGECPDPTDGDSPLRELPDELLHTFTEAGICLDLLEKHLLLEDDVYGG